MTKPNDTVLELNRQLMKVKKCSNALQDIYFNIPEEDRYASALSIIGDSLDKEVDKLQVLIITSLTSN